MTANRFENTDAWGEPISPKPKAQGIADLDPELEQIRRKLQQHDRVAAGFTNAAFWCFVFAVFAVVVAGFFPIFAISFLSSTFGSGDDGSPSVLVMGLTITAGIGAFGGIICGLVTFLAARFLRQGTQRSYESVP